MKGNSVRRMIAALAATTVGLGTSLVLASSASATITSPGQDGAVLRGTVSIADSGATDSSSLCITGSGAQTTLTVLNSANASVFTNTQGGAGAKSWTLDTHTWVNGNYTLKIEERNKTGTVFCGNNTVTLNRPVVVDNVTALDYTGATSGAQNTTVTVKAKLTDPNLTELVLPGRVVTFALSGGTSVNGTTDANGVATATLPVAGPPRTATLTASFAQTAYYKGSTAPVTFDVKKNASATTVQPPASMVHGETTSFTAHVVATDGNSTPTGTIQFTIDGDDFGAPVPITAGAASSNAIATLSTGNHAIGARYNGDANIAASTAAAQQLTVGKAPTTTALTSTGSPTVSGQAVTFTATVDVLSPGVGAPVGGVQFDVDGDPYGTAVPLNGDHADLSISNLPPGNHTVSATYNGNVDFAASTSGSMTHGVDRADTNLALATSKSPSVAGEPVIFTANLTVAGPGSGNPTGQVQFYADGDAIGSPVAITAGSAVSAPIGLPAGSHAITADYAGDARFAGSSAALTQTVHPAQTTTTVVVSPSPSVFGQSVALKANVAPKAPATGNPEGSVRFFVDNVDAGFVDLVDGEAELSTSTLTVGSHTVKAVYFSSDPNFLTSTSATVNHQVNKAATSTSVTSSATPAVFGQPITFTATVGVESPGAGNPSGEITFTDGDTVLGTAPISSLTGGIASVSVSTLGVGQHAVVATYSGDGSFSGSEGSVAQKVQRAQTSTLVTSSANPSQPGAAVRFTATVTPIAPGAGVPAGTVQFKVNGAALGAPVALTDGVATSPDFTNLAQGTYRISAVYSGEPRFVTSTGLLDQGNGQVVGKAGTDLGLVVDAETSEPGQTVTFTATVQTVAPATGRATGTVQFWDGDVLIGAVGLTPAEEARTSTATFTTSTLAPGAHTVRATFGGNATYSTSTGSVTHTVTVLNTVTGISSSANPSSYGDTVTFTAVVADSIPAAGKPTGTVTFTDGTTVLGTAALATVNGQQVAKLQVSTLVAGSHAVKASYAGDSSRQASTSPALTQVVQRVGTTLVDLHGTKSFGYVSTVYATLKDAHGAPLAGQSLTMRTAGTLPGGDGQRLLCVATTDENGVGKCTVPPIHRQWVTSSGFDVFFDGTANLAPVSDHGIG